METQIEQYLQNERGIESKVVRQKLLEKVTRYDDIAQNFMRWLETREYGNELEIEGYTAQKIHELAPHLSGIGVFNFLVTLRDNPDEAQKIIAEGFTIR